MTRLTILSQAFAPDFTEFVTIKIKSKNPCKQFQKTIHKTLYRLSSQEPSRVGLDYILSHHRSGLDLSDP